MARTLGEIRQARVRPRHNLASGCDVPVGRIVDYLALRHGQNPEREYVPGGRKNLVSVAKLRALVPGVDELLREYVTPRWTRMALDGS